MLWDFQGFFFCKSRFNTWMLIPQSGALPDRMVTTWPPVPCCKQIQQLGSLLCKGPAHLTLSQFPEAAKLKGSFAAEEDKTLECLCWALHHACTKGLRALLLESTSPLSQNSKCARLLYVLKQLKCRQKKQPVFWHTNSIKCHYTVKDQRNWAWTRALPCWNQSVTAGYGIWAGQH